MDVFATTSLLNKFVDSERTETSENFAETWRREMASPTMNLLVNYFSKTTNF